MKPYFYVVTVLLFLNGISFDLTAKNDYKYDYLYKNLPFKMEKICNPTFPSTTLSIIDCGGVGDGITLNTEAFSKAMTQLSSKGGGTLTVPFGVWLTGPIEFKSNINLHLENGALILFSGNFNDYPLVKTSFEGQETRRCQSPISGRNLVNIAITGNGTINGSGQVWRPLKRAKVTESYWKNVVSSGGVLKNPDYWLPSQKALKGELLFEAANSGSKVDMTDDQWDAIKDFLRPVMVSFIECKNVYLQGVLFENSPSWNIHPFMCENVIVDGVFIRNPAFAQNGDGLDIESCKNAIVVNSTLDVGDDAICLKSGKDAEGRKRGKPTENVIVDNCKVFKGHGGFVVGSEMSGGVRNVSVSNCQFMGTDVGLRFKSVRGRGGVVENIYINNISMFDITTDSFLFDLFYGGKSASESLDDGDENKPKPEIQIADVTTPVFRNIFVNNIVSRNARRAMFFNGLPEMNIQNIHVTNSQISAEYGAELVESDGVVFKNIEVIPQNGAAFILKNVKNFKASKLIYPHEITNPIQVSGNNSRNIDIEK